MAIDKALPTLNDLKEHAKWLTGIHLIFGSVTVCTLLYNVFNIIPDSMSFIVVIFNRSMQALGVALAFLYVTALKPWASKIMGLENENNVNESKTKSTTTGQENEEVMKFNFLKALSRLSFALYICNYLVIRTLFYTSRNIFPTTAIDWVSTIKLDLLLLNLSVLLSEKVTN